MQRIFCKDREGCEEVDIDKLSSMYPDKVSFSSNKCKEVYQGN